MLKYSFGIALAGILLLLAVTSLADPLLAYLPAPVPPQEVARREVCVGQRGSFRVHRVYEGRREALVLYTTDCLPGPSPYFGRMQLGRIGRSWGELSRNATTMDDSVRPEELVSHESGGLVAGTGERYAFVYGQILAPGRVRAVEASFDDGSVVRDAGAGGVFYLFADGSAGPCELRVLGDGDRVVRRIDTVATSAAVPSVSSAPPPHVSADGGVAWEGASRATRESCDKTRR